MRAAAFLIAALLPLSAAAQGLVPLEGWFIAEEPCEAFQSKNRKTNPGDIRVQPARAYDMLALNKPGGDFFQVRVPGAPVTADRWVHASCGVHAVAAETQVDRDPPPGDVTPPEGPESTDNLLTLSWQPAFCEGKPDKTECQALNAGLLPVTETQLSIHGLWPQPNGTFWCGVPEAVKRADRDRRWDELPAPEVDAETRDALVVAMPGTASHLDRHEWIKHGTCYRAAGGADEYFDDTLRLTEAVNGSAVGAFLAAHVGAEIETVDLRALFDAEFGTGAGDRVQVQCKGDGGRVLVVEVWLALQGEITDAADLGALMLAADPVSAGCPRGVVDAAGLQ